MSGASGAFEPGGAKLGRIFEDLTIFYTKAHGEIISNDGSLPADFEIFQLFNGNIVIVAITHWNTTSIDEDGKYALRGETPASLQFRVNNAFLISWREIFTDQQSQSPQGYREWIFSVSAGEHLQFQYGGETYQSCRKFRFALTNVLASPNFRLRSDQYGLNISFRRSLSEDQDQYVIMTQRIPMVSGFLTVEAYDNLSLESASEIADDMRYLISLAEGHLVSIPYVKMLSDQDIILQKYLWECRMGYPLPKFNPIDRKEIFPFLSSAFPAFHQRSVENRNELKITFEYYLNARESSLVEGNFSNAFTMLERLASSYRKVGKPELAGISKTIRKQLRSKLSEHVNDMQEGGQLSSEAAETLNRRIDHIFSRQPTFLEMVSQLLTEYNVEFEDLFPDINRLQSLRNDIVHKGKVQSPSVFQDAQNLLKLLNRIVLAII